MILIYALSVQTCVVASCSLCFWRLRLKISRVGA